NYFFIGIRMEFKKLLRDIKALKIQGAESVAKEAANGLRIILKKSKARTAPTLLSELKRASAELIRTRPTEPAMRNSIRFILHNLDKEFTAEKLSKRVNEKIDEVNFHFTNSREKIVAYAINKIKDNSVVFTHCHSSTVVSILKKAHSNKTNFSVHNTETRPLFQGRKTSKELVEKGIDVTHYTDSAAIFALKKADICFFGGDAIQSDGRIINKTGTAVFVELAQKYDIPIFFCINSWKFDPITLHGFDEVIEHRKRSEVWNRASKNIKIYNPAFEAINPQKVTGVISELGVYRPEVFPDLVSKSYPFIS
ncbi:MAG: translation initiation factor eIF-2B, partial [Nanobdellota archaeon]